MRPTAAALLFALVTIPAALASADDPPAVALRGSSSAATGVAGDPNIDRSFLLPTAMTQPQGTLTYNNYELLLHGLTYGITDNLQVSATMLAPITKDFPLFVVGALKGRVLSADRLQLSLQGTLTYGGSFDEDDDISFVMLGGGGLASYCLREDCASLLSASVSYQYAKPNDGDGGNLLLYGGSLVTRLGSRVKLLLEVVSAAGQGSGDDLENAPGLLANYGVRFHGSSLAGDVGFMKPFFDEDDDELLMGFPFINLSYRW